jgi:hypothetical protein
MLGELDIERVGVYNNPTLNQAMRIQLFGEVAKAVVMRPDGRYQVVYE